MREVPIGQEKIKVRGLTVKEIKKLKDEGIPCSRAMFNVNAILLDEDLADRSMDAILQICMDPDDYKRLFETGDTANKDNLELWKAVLAETWGSKDEEKN